jgi:ParB-like chromosome segregation protein Spo0J
VTKRKVKEMPEEIKAKYEMGNVPINLLAPNPWNTNVVSPENEERLEASLKRLGVFRPIIVRELSDGSLQIVGGEHRWEIAKRNGYTEVPIVNLGQVSDKVAKEVGLADNARYGADDVLSLSQLLKELGTAESLQEFLPYETEDLNHIFASTSISLEDLDLPDDEVPPTMPEPRSGSGFQIMRFKVPIEDSEWITKIIDSVMRSEGFTKEDSMLNAGNAFVHIFKQFRG